jgi:hypothetical protein
MLIDNIIIYNQTVGDTNINFLEVLLLYFEFKYLVEESNDQFDKQLMIIIYKLSFETDYKP